MNNNAIEVNFKNSLKNDAEKESNGIKSEIMVHNLKDSKIGSQGKQECDLKDLKKINGENKNTSLKESSISTKESCFSSTNVDCSTNDIKLSSISQNENQVPQDNPNVSFFSRNIIDNVLSENSSLSQSIKNSNNTMESLTNCLNQLNLNQNRINPSFNFVQNNLIQNNNDVKKMPLFSSKTSETKNQNNITKYYILTCFSDTNSTKLLQKIVNEAPESTINDIINELKGTFHTIIRNKNGNYFCVDLFKVCNTQHRIEILKELYKTISDDCTDKFASHPIQVLVEYSSCEEEYNLILESFYDYNKALLACLDPNGSFVVQKIIKRFPEKCKTNFNKLFVSFLCFIIGKKFGVVNAKTFIDHTKNEDIINQVISCIIEDFFNIATNQFGNFFIQHILDKWFNDSKCIKLKEKIIENFRALFENKYSSYICDLFLKKANNEDRKNLIKTLNLNNSNNSTDKKILVRIMRTFEKNFNNNKNNNHNNNNNNNNINNNNLNFMNQNLLYSNLNANMTMNMNNFTNFNAFNNFNNNGVNQNNFLNQNQFPLSLNNFGRNNMMNNNNMMFFNNNNRNNK